MAAHEKGEDWFGTTNHAAAERHARPSDRRPQKSSLGAVEYWLPHRDRIPFMDAQRHRPSGPVAQPAADPRSPARRGWPSPAPAPSTTRSPRPSARCRTASPVSPHFPCRTPPPQSANSSAPSPTSTSAGLPPSVPLSTRLNWERSLALPDPQSGRKPRRLHSCLHPFNSRIRTPLPRYHMVKPDREPARNHHRGDLADPRLA